MLWSFCFTDPLISLCPLLPRFVLLDCDVCMSTIFLFQAIRFWLYFAAAVELVVTGAALYLAHTQGPTEAGHKLLKFYDTKVTHKSFSSQHIRLYIIYLLYIGMIRFLAAFIAYDPHQLATPAAGMVRHINVIAHLVESVWMTFENYKGYQDQRAELEEQEQVQSTWSEFRKQQGFNGAFYALWTQTVVFLMSDLAASL
eukprot:TRINITY_DN1376_c0_g1_i1.p1 TRINITY_DN1376_c0_g1~~TRINITY_DN1376_c0_g1_i1.p1  ORF type:complete len:199 (-),score=35.35 TRINITY_DN1376_c0_g1_i1:108-704(-)